MLSTGVASSSGLQRQMRVGFTRAARMVAMAINTALNPTLSVEEFSILAS